LIPCQLFIIEGDHVTAYFIKITSLVDRDKDGVVGSFHEEITFFRGFNAYREKDRTSTGSAYTEIAVSLLDIIQDLRGYRDMADFRCISRITRHYVSSIVRNC